MSAHIFVLINARRWKDSNGNTYYTTRTRFIIGECVSEPLRVPITYGYGDAYRTETISWLLEDGHLPKGAAHTVLTSVTDVSKRSQLLSRANDEL